MRTRDPTVPGRLPEALTAVSLIYTTNFAGCMIGAVLNIWLTDRLGFGLVTPLAALSQAIAFLLAGTGAPFGVFLVAFLFNGFGLSIQDAQVNNLTTRLPNPAVLMSFVQASFSGGATVAPFLATAFAQHLPRRSYLYFLVAMGVALIATLILVVAFKGMTEEQIVGSGAKRPDAGAGADGDVEAPVVEEKPLPGDLARRPCPAQEELPAGVVPIDATAGDIGEGVQLEAQSSGAKLKRILRRPAIYVLMSWSFLYIGVEVGTSSWLTTFLIRERGAGPAAGYAVTGFWGAMTLGRILLIPVTHRLGSQTAIYAYALVALALEFAIWFADSVPGNAVCYAVIGFFLGPIYPVALMVISETWDDELRGGVMGLMGSVGGAGAALGPFIMGGISDRYGIWAIQPVAVAMIGGFTALWALTPKPKRAKKAKKAKEASEPEPVEMEMAPTEGGVESAAGRLDQQATQQQT